MTTNPLRSALTAPGELMDEFETAMVEGGYHKPERSPFSNDAYLYERDQDRFNGFEMARSAPPAQSAPGISEAEIETLAHRYCFKYVHSDDPSMRQYDFSPLTLHNFARVLASRTAAQGSNHE